MEIVRNLVTPVNINFKEFKNLNNLCKRAFKCYLILNRFFFYVFPGWAEGEFHNVFTHKLNIFLFVREKPLPIIITKRHKNILSNRLKPIICDILHSK